MEKVVAGVLSHEEGQVEVLGRLIDSERQAEKVKSAIGFMPQGLAFSRATLENLPGLCLHDVMQLPISRLQAWMQGLGQELGRYAGTIKKEAAQADLAA